MLLLVAHRHVVLTIPRLLRPLFRRRRDLLGELTRARTEAVKQLLRHASGEADARPGIVVSVATAGISCSGIRIRTHHHRRRPKTRRLVAHAGGVGRRAVMRLFREQLLGSLLAERAISQELVRKLLAWRHPGFSAHVGEPITASDTQRLEDTTAYLVRNPLSLNKLVYSITDQPRSAARLRDAQAVGRFSSLNSAVSRKMAAPMKDASVSGATQSPQSLDSSPSFNESVANPTTAMRTLRTTASPQLPEVRAPVHPLLAISLSLSCLQPQRVLAFHQQLV